VAVKMMSNIFSDIYCAKKELSEINVLRKLTSISSNQFTTLLYDIVIPNIDYDNSEPIQHIFLVMEMVATDLNSVIADSDSLEIDEEHMTIIMYNLLCCMNYIHSSNLIHRDIKPSNILVQNDCGIKICDFGLARSMPKSKFDMDKHVKKTIVIDNMDADTDTSSPGLSPNEN
jgi:mitogen-activated protein kinase 1/3